MNTYVDPDGKLAFVPAILWGVGAYIATSFIEAALLEAQQSEMPNGSLQPVGGIPLASGFGAAATAGKFCGTTSGITKGTPFNRKAITEGFQDHHIISDENALTKNHELLDLAGFDLQSRPNKIFLPRDGTLHPTRSIHLGRHRTSVSRNLAEQMDAVVNYGKQNGFAQGQYGQALRSIVSQERQLLRAGQRALNKHHRPGAQ